MQGKLRTIVQRRYVTIAAMIALIMLLAACSSKLLSAPTNDSKSSAITYLQAEVLSVAARPGQPTDVRLRMISGSERNTVQSARVGAVITSLDLTPPRYLRGQRVLVSRETNSGSYPVFVVIDHYRLRTANWLLAAVLIIAVVFAGIRGIGALIGLGLSIVIIAKFIIPQIISGHNPFIATALGIMAISLLGIYASHGFSRRTSLALISTYITLLAAVGMSALMLSLLGLSGIASEDTFFLSQHFPHLNISGLLLCGTLISLIGVLDDVTVGQSTAVQELHTANPRLNALQLYRSGLVIGREHIASLINSLVLVYVGTTFTFVFYLSALSPYPLLVNLNSELIMEEVARSLIGGATLILAIPISTALAARFLPAVAPKLPAKSGA